MPSTMLIPQDTRQKCLVLVLKLITVSQGDVLVAPGPLEDGTRGSVNHSQSQHQCSVSSECSLPAQAATISLGLSHFLCSFGSPIAFPGFSNSHIKAPLPFK